MEVMNVNTNQSNQDELYDAARQAIDETFGAGTTISAEGRADQAVGHVAVETGEIAGDPALGFAGAGLEALGIAERVEGKLESNYAKAYAQVSADIAANRAEMASLQAEYEAANAADRAEVQAKMDATRAKAQATQDRINAALEQAKTQHDAKIASLRQQAAQATGEAKAKIDEQIAQLDDENKQFAANFNKALAQNSLVLSR
jgi:hypothetical protein